MTKDTIQVVVTPTRKKDVKLELRGNDPYEGLDFGMRLLGTLKSMKSGKLQFRVKTEQGHIDASLMVPASGLGQKYFRDVTTVLETLVVTMGNRVLLKSKKKTRASS